MTSLDITNKRDYEVELKFILPDRVRFENQVLEMGYKLLGTGKQIDIYLQHPVRDFSETDEALRIRFDNRQGNITYKGPLVDSIAKTRREIELPFHPDITEPAKILEMFTLLGFRRVLDVKKTRTLYHSTFESREIHLCIDQVDGLGDYVELEMICSECEKEQVRDLLLKKAFELSLENSERRSYLRLLLAKQG